MSVEVVPVVKGMRFWVNVSLLATLYGSMVLFPVALIEGDLSSSLTSLTYLVGSFWSLVLQDSYQDSPAGS